ncbi:MAG: Capsule biosynthesis protein CapA [Bacteroidetes bacterium ADurb.Bin234]|nr:MAG: Capsule biosynthesis protein CapA [Bacteroidetes bacterium ADurb.Bin234]
MVTLANNHILDYGAKGLKNTIDALKSCQINYVGAGMNLKDAAAPFSIDCDGIRIAILNFTENEWSIAEENKPGANPLNIIDNLNYIKAARAVHDKVICIIHGGHEFYKYHFYAEQGADAIVGHHTHCIGGFEIYKNVPIIYSLGNFLFTLTSKNEEWYTGLLAELTINKENSIKFKLLPIRQRKENFEVYLLKEEKSAAVMRQIKEINKTILNRDNLQESWLNYIQKNTSQYLNTLSFTNGIGNYYVRLVLQRLGFGKFFLSKEYLKLILNLMRCEAHSDIIKETIKKYLGDN